MPRLGALVLLTAVLVPTAAHGQVGSTTDILTGVVIGMDDAPLAGAQVEATSIETQITRRQVTDARGRYTIVFPDGGGQYQLVVRYIGLTPQRIAVVRQADEDRLVTNVHMTATPYTLPAVVARGRQPGRRDQEAAALPQAGTTTGARRARCGARRPHGGTVEQAAGRAEARARQQRTSLTFWARDSGLNGFCM